MQLELSQEKILARRLVCKGCTEYNKDRCTKIDLGCRRTFIATVSSPDGKCPDGKWEEIVVQAAPVACQFEQRSLDSVRCKACGRVILTSAPPSTVYAECRIQQPDIDKLETNLIYHVCALDSNDHWIDNIQQLVKRWRVFTQRKIVAVAVGDGMRSLEEVKQYFPGDAEFIEVENDKRLREVKTFLPLLEAVKTLDMSATFYAHTKGNSTADDVYGAKLWRNAMYHYLLDHYRACLDILQSHPCVGTTKMVWARNARSPFPTGLGVGTWMYAGTFFWFRNDLVFSHPDWSLVSDDRYGAEAWLSGLFEQRQAPSVFQPWPVDEWPIGSPYDPNNYLPFAKAFE